ncbi:MAG: CDP-alcohol phosphatidyltransferase family protein [Archangium sp.]
MRWSFVHAVLCLVTGVWSVASASLWPFVAGSGVSMLFFFITARTAQPRLAGVGIANAITLLRLLVLLAGALFFPSTWTFGLVLLLDGMDGFVARRLGETSEFGALFDMETDGVLMGLLALHLSPVAPWVLLVGVLRPAYVLARIPFPRSATKEPRTWLGRSAFTIAAWALVFSCASFAAPVVTALTVAATCAISASFFLSFTQLRR